MAEQKEPDENKLERAQIFARKLAEYLTKKYNEPYEVLPPIKGVHNLWYVRSPSLLAIREPSDKEGTVYIYSYDLLRLDWLFADDDIEHADDIEHFLIELKDRSKWDYLAKRACPYMVAYLTWADAIAKKASEEKKTEIEHWFPSKEYPALKRSSFRAVIDVRDMSEEEEIKAIDVRIPAVVRAYELASDRKSWESFRDEFVRNIKLGKQLGESS